MKGSNWPVSEEYGIGAVDLELEEGGMKDAECSFYSNHQTDGRSIGFLRHTLQF